MIVLFRKSSNVMNFGEKRNVLSKVLVLLLRKFWASPLIAMICAEDEYCAGHGIVGGSFEPHSTFPEQ